MEGPQLYLSGRELNDLATQAEIVDAVHEGYALRGDGDPATSPARIGTDDSVITSYTVSFPEWNVMGGYMYAVGDDVWYTTPLFAVDTGELKAILDGAVWNPAKTGAVAGVGTEYLAVEDASSVGVVGSAQIARSSLEAVATVRNIKTVEVYSPTESSRVDFAENVRADLNIDAEPVESSGEAVSDVDIVIVATDSPEPVIDGEHISPGTHINAMGAAHPKREIDVETFRKVDKYVPDIKSRVFGHSVQERQRSARGFLEALDANAASENTLYGELSQLAVGRLPGRTDDEEITLVDSVGTAIETVSAAHMLYERAVEEGLGTPIENIPRHESDAL
jgi:alanine dehydrogenase